MTNTQPTSQFAVSLAAQLENLRAWVYLMLLGTAGRFLWLFKTRHELDDSVTSAEWGRFFVTGLRFDGVAMTYLMLPLVLMACLLCFAPSQSAKLRKLRHGWMMLLSFAWPVLAFCNVSYYQAFRNTFDEFLFEFFEGNSSDIIAIAYTEYGLVTNTLASLAIGLISCWGYTRFFSQPIEFAGAQPLLSRRSTQVAVTMALFGLVGIGIRGRIGTRPIQRVDCGVTAHRALNLGSLNPLHSLKLAWRMKSRSVDYFGDEKLVSELNLAEHTAVVARTIDAPLHAVENPTNFSFPAWQRTAPGPPNVRPSHVFVLFLESYDSWPFLDEYRELGLVESGHQLGAEGHRLMKYIAGANSSVRSSLICTQGLFQTNRAQQQCLPTSLVHTFQRLGYRTRSVNSFTSEWGDAQRIADEQGFEEIYCTAEIKPGGDTGNLQLHDRTLYEFAENNLSYDKPTFNFIRSSSYHGPFEVDLEAEDCLIPPFPERIRKLGLNDEDNLRLAYGHLKYTDKMAGQFVRRMIRRYPNSLFVITGDHYGRHFPTNNPPVYEGCSVPLILYGPNVLKNTVIPENMAASHVDMTSTLVELCAPKDFTYTALGKSVFAPCSDPVGVGEDHVIFPQSIVSLREPARCVPLPWFEDDVISETDAAAQIARARAIYDAYHGIGYMMARRSLENEAARVAKKKASEKRF